MASKLGYVAQRAHSLTLTNFEKKRYTLTRASRQQGNKDFTAQSLTEDFTPTRTKDLAQSRRESLLLKSTQNLRNST